MLSLTAVRFRRLRVIENASHRLADCNNNTVVLFLSKMRTKSSIFSIPYNLYVELTNSESFVLSQVLTAVYPLAVTVSR